jgi:hypothetical protein
VGGLRRGGAVLVAFTLLTAITGVAGAADRAATAHHDARGDAAGRARIAERRRDHRTAADRRQDLRSGTWHLPRGPGVIPGTRLAPLPARRRVPASPAGPAAGPPVTGRPTVTGAGAAAAAAANRGVAGSSAVQPAQPARSGSARSRRAKAAAGALAAAGAALPAPWFLSPGALGALSSGFGSKPLHAAVHLALPIALTIAVLLFLIVQAQIDKRDPKLTRAPIDRDDDGMSFE